MTLTARAPAVLCILLGDLGGLRALEGRFVEARTLGREAILCGQALGDRRAVAWSLQTIAMVEAAEGQSVRAGRLFGAAEALLGSVGATGQITVTRVQDHYLRKAIASAGDEFRAAAAEGRRLSFHQAIQEAVGKTT